LVVGVVSAARFGTFVARNTSVFTAFGTCIARTAIAGPSPAASRLANDIRPWIIPGPPADSQPCQPRRSPNSGRLPQSSAGTSIMYRTAAMRAPLMRGRSRSVSRGDAVLPAESFAGSDAWSSVPVPCAALPFMFETSRQANVQLVTRDPIAPKTRSFPSARTTSKLLMKRLRNPAHEIVKSITLSRGVCAGFSPGHQTATSSTS
jgi:hypothetical protein